MEKNLKVRQFNNSNTVRNIKVSQTECILSYEMHLLAGIKKTKQQNNKKPNKIKPMK